MASVKQKVSVTLGLAREFQVLGRLESFHLISVPSCFLDLQSQSDDGSDSTFEGNGLSGKGKRQEAVQLFKE